MTTRPKRSTKCPAWTRRPATPRTKATPKSIASAKAQSVPWVEPSTNPAGMSSAGAPR